MGNYASKDGETDSSQVHDSIPSRTAPPLRQYRSDEPTGQRPSDEQTSLALEGDMDNTVPTVFKWEHGGRNVYITGTFNNWERQIPMHRSGNDFSYVHNLKRGKHAFKFIVDDEWRFAPDQPTVADIEGRINNFIDVSDFAPYIGDDNFFLKSKGRVISHNARNHPQSSNPCLTPFLLPFI